MTQWEVRTKHLIETADTLVAYPLVFGGALYGQMDICAYLVARKFLHGTVASAAVTHKSNVTFYLPSYVGDVLDIVGDVVSANKKSIVIKVKAWRDIDLIADVEHVFISIDNTAGLDTRPKRLPYVNHDKPYKLK